MITVPTVEDVDNYRSWMNAAQQRGLSIHENLHEYQGFITNPSAPQRGCLFVEQHEINGEFLRFWGSTPDVTWMQLDTHQALHVLRQLFAV
jgi:hypothetical protein